MKKLNIVFLFLLLPFFTQQAQTAGELISEGDSYYKKFDNQKALEFYKKAEKLEPGNYEVLWRISRAYVDIGEHMPSSTDEQKDEQLKTYKKALEYAEKAVKAAPDKSVTYLRRAIANGRIALYKGVFSVASVVNSVKADLEKAIELGNGGNDIQAIAHYVLARTHAKTSEKWKPARSVLGLGWADNEIAIKEYKKAIELKPNFVMFYVDYAHSLIREDDYETARKMLKKALESPIEDEDDSVRKQEAKDLLEEIKDE
ncbi:Tetratricopeptide TPR_2 repeat protein [Melioribacter roseus P3M-2]|uniref:Tetratricopeptide TPR_2 repeat protein n=1 Tax=Melioribacter roseus (strain DSM 23840 / JCM 17771 / VKM B-2668 / P3M-2) TaxID=1191523 RepID=I6ZXL8_MELRP|nr:tetratricopeptide repeat protein [Melioribacter roseus]AFN73798.1 Tetratricopeptide TPR_2 repeat protein [Melioribacter roseus P3M-2]